VTFLTEANRKWWTLGALCFSLFMIMLDNTIVTVALPSMQVDLQADLSELEWVVNAYSITFAVLLLSAGKLADMFGRRRIFVAGLVVFTASSLACGLAETAGVLIGARAVQGAGAALMLPATLSILAATFPVQERGMAIGIWAGVSGVALAIGPLAGGLLVEGIDWRWIFYVNIPFGVLGVIATVAVVAESRDTSPDQSLDLPGLLAAAISIFAFSFALIEANSYGWTSATIISLFAVAAVALAVFVALELRQRRPMLELSLFREPTFTGANVVSGLIFCAMFGFIFFMSLYMQNILGYSPIEAGAAFLTSTLAIMLTAPVAGMLTDRYGARWPMAAGMVMFGVGLLFLTRLDERSSFWDILPWFVLGGLGFGLVVAPSTAAILSSVSIDKGGVASGVMQSFRQLGGALGIAICGAIMAASLDELTPRGPAFVDAFVDGLHDVLVFSGLVSIAGGLVAAATIRRSSEIAAAERTEPDPSHA
jgi:EmrB/QacA subfamily drug resistance transporter